MSLFDPTTLSELRAVLAALRQGSPVVLDVPEDVRCQLLQRYVDVSQRNAGLSLLSFGLVLFVAADAAPWWPRVLAFAVMFAIAIARHALVRRWRSSAQAQAPRFDRRHDLLVILAMGLWNSAPFALEGRIPASNLAVVVYAAQLSLTVLAVSHVAAQPASLLASLFSMVALVTFHLHQGTLMSAMMALSTVTLTFALQSRMSDNHRTLLKALAADRQNALLVKELERLRQQLEMENRLLGLSLRDASQAASRDALTGLFNRRHLLAQAPAMAELVATRHAQVVVCMIDIDHFKSVNDGYGHAVGDAVLRQLARGMTERLRDGDCVARLGGEEFVALLRGCDLHAGRRLADLLRESVAATRMETEAGDLPITVSIGVAQWAPGEALADVLSRADLALYQAKHKGRNRVEAAEPALATPGRG